MYKYLDYVHYFEIANNTGINIYVHKYFCIVRGVSSDKCLRSKIMGSKGKCIGRYC